MKQGHESVLLPSLHARRNVFIALTALMFVSAMTYLLWQIHAVDGQRRALAMDQFRGRHCQDGRGPGVLFF